MFKMISIASTGVVLAMTAMAGVLPANAAMPMGHGNYQQQDRYIGNFCDRHPNARQCNDWRMNHGRWNDTQYQGFYRSHRHNDDFGGNFAAGLFGFTAGVVLNQAINNSSRSYRAYAGDDDHVQACSDRFQSYNERSDTYLGFDGARHVCEL